MTEQEHVDLTNTWRLHDVAASLHTALDHCDDVVRGLGYRFTFLEIPGTTPTLLDLYPERLVARYRSPLFELDLAHIRLVEPLVGKIRIDAGDSRATATIFVEAKGALTFTVTPEESIVSMAVGEEPPPGEAEMPGPEVSETGQLSAEYSQSRVNLVGRVGAQTNFRTTPKGVLIARFPLAVRESENKTSWHTVLAFGPRAVKLEGTIKKGDTVEVIGYTHVREFVKRDGSKKTVEEIYAVVVKNR
jgi:hypothetical protein